MTEPILETQAFSESIKEVTGAHVADMETAQPRLLDRGVKRIYLKEPRIANYTVESSGEITESQQRLPSVRETIGAEDVERNERARGNALMDADCLRFLRMFSQRKYLYVDDLNKEIAEPKGWLKITMLVRADYLESLDSTVRITPEGLAAWESFRQLSEFRHDEA